MRRILSAKSTTTIELPPRLAVTEPSRLTSGRSVSTAAAASIDAQPEDLGDEAVAAAAPADPTGAVAAAPSTGWMRNAPPAIGTATKPLARSVERNNSKYSERDSGRSVTTDTLPWTRADR